MKFKFLFFFIYLLLDTNLNAQNRIAKPVQIHLNGSGLFIKAFGNTLADSEIDDLTIKKWGLPGLSIGYHLNKRFYLGYAFQPNINLILKEPWTFGTEEKDGNVTLDHNSGNFHTIEGRYFPFNFDLYGSVLLTHISKAKYAMDFDRIGNSIKFGDNSYTTDIKADWNFKSLTTIGVGIGYNYVHKSGISFDLGIGIPIPISEPLYENIEIISKQGIVLAQSDIEAGRSKIENELFYFPIQFHVNIGYNFNLK